MFYSVSDGRAHCRRSRPEAAGFSLPQERAGTAQSRLTGGARCSVGQAEARPGPALGAAYVTLGACLSRGSSPNQWCAVSKLHSRTRCVDPHSAWCSWAIHSSPSCGMDGAASELKLPLLGFFLEVGAGSTTRVMLNARPRPLLWEELPLRRQS